MSTTAIGIVVSAVLTSSTFGVIVWYWRTRLSPLFDMMIDMYIPERANEIIEEYTLLEMQATAEESERLGEYTEMVLVCRPEPWRWPYEKSDYMKPRRVARRTDICVEQ
jgi:hypothetical protein